jgi:ABC-type uncharacterized transport system substrate-binding protein
MAINTVGIMHSGSLSMCQDNIKILTGFLNNAGIPSGRITILTADNGSLQHNAKQLVGAGVDLLIAAGGSRSAEAAINARPASNLPKILFTSVSPYLLKNGVPTNTAGVDAHSSDHDGARFNYLVKMPLNGTRIGVLFNSDRTDKKDQMDAINKAAGNQYTPVPLDINGPKTLPELFTSFKGNVHALLVAAHPWFNNNRKDVFAGANALLDSGNNHVPAIFQWREFVALAGGGLMSYGPNISSLYTLAGQMAAQIVNNNGALPNQRVQEPTEADFELVVNTNTAAALGLNVPKTVTNDPHYHAWP